MAQSCQRDSLGRMVRLHRVFGPLLEPTNRFVPGHSALSRFAGPAAAAHAAVDLLAWSGGICTQCREPAHLHPRPSLSARSLVLFPRALPFEIAVGVPFAPPSCRRDGLDCEAAFTRAFGDTDGHGPALAERLGFPGGFRRCLPAEPIGPEHPAFLGCAGAYCLVARPPPARAGTAARLEPASGTHRKLAHDCARADVHRYGNTRLPELFSLLEHSQHGTAGLHLGQRLESRLEPRSSRSGEFRAPARSEAGSTR